MAKLFRLRWLIGRLLVIAANVAAIPSISPQQTDMDWTACFLISIFWSGFLYVTLAMMRYKANIDWSEPFSWLKPFLPMRQYPLRFWLLVPFSFIPAGLITIVLDFVYYKGSTAFGTTVLLIGIISVVILKTWIYRCANR